MSEIEVFSRLANDGSKVLIEFEEDGAPLTAKVMNAEQMQVFLQELGRARAGMAEKVPRKLEPNPVFKDVTRNAVSHVGRPHTVSKEIFVAVRHEGFGWLAFTISNENAILLSTLILREAEANTPKIIKPNSGLIV